MNRRRRKARCSISMRSQLHQRMRIMASVRPWFAKTYRNSRCQLLRRMKLIWFGWPRSCWSTWSKYARRIKSNSAKRIKRMQEMNKSQRKRKKKKMRRPSSRRTKSQALLSSVLAQGAARGQRETSCLRKQTQAECTKKSKNWWWRTLSK